jgi:fucose permease
MGTLHAAFSGGAAVGALVGGAVAGAGVPVLTHFALIATPLTVVGALYLVEALGTSTAFGAAGFVAFSAAMVVGRLSQDRLVHRLGDDAVRRTGAAVAAGAMAAALLTDDPRTAVVALGAVGIGLAAIFPVTMSAAGRLPGIAPAQAVAVVSATAYGALLAGPPLIELLADATTLRAALWTVVGALLLTAVLRTRSPTGDG